MVRIAFFRNTESFIIIKPPLKKRSKLACSLLKDKNFCYRVLQFSKTWKIIFFPESAAVAETFLKDTNISWASCQREVRKLEVDGIFCHTLGHACTLVILKLLFGCCMFYFRENLMTILLLETLFLCFNMSIFNNFNTVFATRFLVEHTFHIITVLKSLNKKWGHEFVGLKHH